jgi:thymidine phosphorylase
VRLEVPPGRAGFVQSMDVRAIGLVVLAMGGGRRRADDQIDPAVGLTAVVQIGDRVGPGKPLAIVHAQSQEDARMAAADLQTAVQVAEDPPPASPVVRARIHR